MEIYGVGGISTTQSDLSVEIDTDIFMQKVGQLNSTSSINFYYYKTPQLSAWYYGISPGGSSVNLAEYGITYTGEPKNATLITVTVVDQWNEIKEALKSDNTFKYYHIYTTLNDYLYPSDNLYPSDTLYPGISSSSSLVIENDELIQESCKYTASIADVGNVQIGKCNAARFEFKTFANVTNEAIGQRIRVTMTVGNYQAEIPIGIFNITEVQRTDISEVVKVVAYDDFVKLDQDVAGWYNRQFAYLGTFEDVNTEGCSIPWNPDDPQYASKYINAPQSGNMLINYKVSFGGQPLEVAGMTLYIYLSGVSEDILLTDSISEVRILLTDKNGETYAYPLDIAWQYGGIRFVDIDSSYFPNNILQNIVSVGLQITCRLLDPTIPNFYMRVVAKIETVMLTTNFNTSIGQWTVGFFSSLCQEINIPFVPVDSVANYENFGDIVRTMIPTALTARSILEQYCIANGVFAIIDRYGKPKFIQLNTTAEEDLTDDSGIAIIKKARAESFDTIENASVYIISGDYIQAYPKSTTEREAGVVIRNNMFIDSIQDKSKLSSVSENISKQINDPELGISSAYTPATVECRGLPYLDLCDKVKVNVKIGNDKQVITTRVINRTMNGIQGLMDTIKGTGTYNTKNIQSNN
jgi:hypothetical protein